MGRTVSNPPNPWHASHVEWDDGEAPRVELEVSEERARSILAENDSPDIPFRWSLNPYRGCIHACAYCYARPSHQYLGLGAGTDFDRRIVVKRSVVVAAPAAPAPAPSAAPAAPAAAPAAPAPAAAPAVTPANHPGAVKSPMVGTVYLAGEPGAPAFVSVGDRVGEGDTLVIIEAMKVMNPITAPRAGVVRQLLVSNAQPVEFDQPLVIIE